MQPHTERKNDMAPPRDTIYVSTDRKVSWKGTLDMVAIL